MKHAVRTVAVASIIYLALSVVRPVAPRTQAPTAPAPAETLVIAGDVTQALTITPADLKAMPRTTVAVSEEGRQISYEGVLVGGLLKRAGGHVGQARGDLCPRKRERRLSGGIFTGGTGSRLHSQRHHRGGHDRR